MGTKRRKIQLELAFMAESRGEAPMAADKGAEASRAKRTLLPDPIGNGKA